MKHQESQFFDAMRPDMELEEKMKSLLTKKADGKGAERICGGD